MLKYVAAVVLVFGLSVYVSTQYKQHAENPASCSQQPANKALPAPANKNSETNISHPKWNPPRWYRLFGWPEGIGVWGLFLTLVAIAEQTHQTRRSADISEQILIADHRPRVIVRTMDLFLRDTSQTWITQLVILNIGGVPAAIKPFEVLFEWVRQEKASVPSPDSQIFLHPVEQFALKAGERRVIEIEIQNSAKFNVALEMLVAPDPYGRTPQTTFPICSGAITYADPSGTERNTGFCRMWNIDKLRFVPSPDTDYEYRD